jgi:hypothetical protein
VPRFPVFEHDFDNAKMKTERTHFEGLTR